MKRLFWVIIFFVIQLIAVQCKAEGDSSDGTPKNSFMMRCSALVYNWLDKKVSDNIATGITTGLFWPTLFIIAWRELKRVDARILFPFNVYCAHAVVPVRDERTDAERRLQAAAEIQIQALYFYCIYRLIAYGAGAIAQSVAALEQ